MALMMDVMCDGLQSMELKSPNEQTDCMAELVIKAWGMVSCNNDFIPAEAGLSITLDILARSNVNLAQPEYYAECLGLLRVCRKRELARVRAEGLWGRIGHMILDTRMELGPGLSDDQVNAAWASAWGREFPKGAPAGTVSVTRRESVTVDQFTFALECVLRQQLGRVPTNSERKHIEKLGAETYLLAHRRAPWHTTT